MGCPTKKHVRPHCFFPALHIFIRFFPKAFRIEPLSRQTLHSSVSDIPEIVHLLHVIYQSIFYKLLISAVRSIGKPGYHILDHVPRHIALLISAAGAAAGCECIHDRGRCIRFRHWKAVLRPVMQDTYRSFRTDSQAVFALPAAIPAKLFKFFYPRPSVLSHIKEPSGTYPDAFTTANALIINHKLCWIHASTCFLSFSFFLLIFYKNRRLLASRHFSVRWLPLGNLCISGKFCFAVFLRVSKAYPMRSFVYSGVISTTTNSGRLNTLGSSFRHSPRLTIIVVCSPSSYLPPAYSGNHP